MFYLRRFICNELIYVGQEATVHSVYGSRVTSLALGVEHSKTHAGVDNVDNVYAACSYIYKQNSTSYNCELSASFAAPNIQLKY